MLTNGQKVKALTGEHRDKEGRITEHNLLTEKYVVKFETQGRPEYRPFSENELEKVE